jgi:hypothetical protein
VAESFLIKGAHPNLRWVALAALKSEALRAENERLRKGIEEHIAWHGSTGHESLRAALSQSTEEG